MWREVIISPHAAYFHVTHHSLKKQGDYVL
jgi:hypothetical protein